MITRNPVAALDVQWTVDSMSPLIRTLRQRGTIHGFSYPCPTRINLPRAQLARPQFLTHQTISLPGRSLFFVLVLLLCAIEWGCSSAGSKTTSARAAGPQTIPVGVVTAERRDFPVYLTGLGSVLAFNTDSIKSRVDGQLVEVNFKEGQNVRKGALLALIDPRPYEVQLNQAQAQLFKDQASLRDAKLNYQRFKDLLQNSGAMSQQQVDTQKATADQLEGTVRN